MPPTSENDQAVSTRRVATSAFAFVLFVAAMVFLMWFQERSIVLTCLQLPGTELSTCLPGADELVGAGGSANQPSPDAVTLALGGSIEPSSGRFAIQIALMGAVAAGAVSLMLLVLFPSDLVKFDGSFKQGNSNLRFGGAVGVFLLIAAGGGYLAYRSVPSETQFKSARSAAIRSQAAAAQMYQNYTGLISGIGDRQNDYARNLLVHGYFRKMRGTYVVHCDVESANESVRLGPDEIPSTGTGSDLRVRFGTGSVLTHVNFEIPIDKLSPGNESAVNMTLERDVADRNLIDLSRTTFDIRESSLESGLNDSVLYVKTELNQGQLEEYCQSLNMQNIHVSKQRGG